MALLVVERRDPGRTRPGTSATGCRFHASTPCPRRPTWGGTTAMNSEPCPSSRSAGGLEQRTAGTGPCCSAPCARLRLRRRGRVVVAASSAAGATGSRPAWSCARGRGTRGRTSRSPTSAGRRVPVGKVARSHEVGRDDTTRPTPGSSAPCLRDRVAADSRAERTHRPPTQGLGRPLRSPRRRVAEHHRRRVVSGMDALAQARRRVVTRGRRRTSFGLVEGSTSASSSCGGFPTATPPGPSRWPTATAPNGTGTSWWARPSGVAERPTSISTCRR